MGVPLIDEIMTSFEAHRRQGGVAAARYYDRQIQNELFCRMWHRTYPHRRELTAAVQEKVIRRLKRLAKSMRARLWDFAIAERVAAKSGDFYTDVAVRLLAHACAGNEAELRFCLDRTRSLFPTVAQRHDELFGEIELELSTGLRPTPALSQTEMARALGVSYATFRSDLRARRWRAIKEDAARHKRRRRWRHVALERQADALRRIRRRFPERVWADLPAELARQVNKSQT